MSKEKPLITPVLLAGCFIILVGFSIRASYGVFQIPIANEFGWPRAEFNLVALFSVQWLKEWEIEKP